MSQAKKTQSTESSFDWSAMFPYIAIPLALIVSAILFVNVLGDPANFEGGDAEKGHPLNVLGTIHKGGFIVPILLGMFLMVIVFSIERLFVISKAWDQRQFSLPVVSSTSFALKARSNTLTR